MAVNQNLKNALADAGLSLEEFASILAVDPKSVGRWIAGTSTPYPRHRAAISRALALDETVLWPDRPGPTVELDGTPHQPSDPDPVDSVRAWADADAPFAPDPVSFIAAATGPIDILDTEIWMRLPGPVADALIAHAASGHQIRVATAAPRPDFAPLLRQSGIQLRCVPSDNVALIRAGSTMLIASHLGGFADQSPALFRVEEDGSDGLFDRLSTLYDTAWNDPFETDTITTVDELEEYRTNAYDDPDDDPEPDSDTNRPSEQAQASDPPADSAPPARRWPGSRGQDRPS